MNTIALMDLATTGNYVPHGNIEEGDCVIGFSFGYREKEGKIMPGRSNQDIAAYLVENLKGKPMILQFEIADAIKEDGQNMMRISAHRNQGEYLDSREVARQAQEIMKDNNWDTAVIIAHPFHIPRIDALCNKLGIRTIVPPGLENVRFDPDSSQEWTRNKEAWSKREREAIAISSNRGWI